MFLSRIRLRREAATKPAFWQRFASTYEGHRALWGLFSDGPERRRDFLYRLDSLSEGPRAFTLSTREPDDGDGLWHVESRPFEPDLRAGDRLRFSLRANPVVARKQPGEKRGARCDVVMDGKTRMGWKQMAPEARPPLAELIHEAGACWISARGRVAGFEVDCTRLRVEGYQVHRLPEKHRDATVATLDFEGLLTVAEPERFLAALRAGFGPAKGFGCGLMLIARA